MAQGTNNIELDRTDWQILRALQGNARLSFAELGRMVNLSRPAVAERMRRLEVLGIIAGYRAEVDLSKLGYGITAFIRLKAQSDRVDTLSELLRTSPEVLECYRGLGDDSFIAKVAVASLPHLESLLDRFGANAQVSTSIALSSVVEKEIVTQGFESRPLDFQI
jgi:Lrp/AsnC family leucine-responsive transcriptional regulator